MSFVFECMKIICHTESRIRSLAYLIEIKFKREHAFLVSLKLGPDTIGNHYCPYYPVCPRAPFRIVSYGVRLLAIRITRVSFEWRKWRKV